MGDQRVKITIEVNLPESKVADVLTHDIESYDDNREPKDGWTLEPLVTQDPASTFRVLIVDILNELKTTYGDDELRARMFEVVRNKLNQPESETPS